LENGKKCPRSKVRTRSKEIHVCTSNVQSAKGKSLGLCGFGDVGATCASLGQRDLRVAEKNDVRTKRGEKARELKKKEGEHKEEQEPYRKKT